MAVMPAAAFTSRISKAVSLLAVVLALVSQTALGSLVLAGDPASAQRNAIAAVGIVCQSDSAHHRPQRPQHRPADPTLCPSSVSLALPIAVLGDAIAVVAPSSVILPSIIARAVARGPPVPVQKVGSPRGPPVLV